MTFLCIISTKPNVYEFECDTCSKHYIKRGISFGRATACKPTYCSEACYKNGFKKGGKTYEKQRQTMFKRYGVEHNFELKEMRDKREQTWLKKYGVTHPFSAEIVKKKIEQTCFERYGVKAPVLIKHVKTAANSSVARKKAFETKKKNGNFNSSKKEDIFYLWLCDHYGKGDVERWLRVGSWEVDCYVKLIATYFQLDGAWYHGHFSDNTYEKYPRWLKTAKTMRERDARQNKWFFDSGLSLLRISDLAFEYDGTYNIDRVNVVYSCNLKRMFSIPRLLCVTESVITNRMTTLIPFE